MIRPQTLAAGVLLAAALLAGCRSTPPVVPTESAPQAPAAPTAAPSPTVEELPTAAPATVTSEAVPPGADQPAVEPGPGTAVPGTETTVEPTGADQPAIEPGPGTPIPTPVATGEVVTDTAAATTLAPELEQVVRDHVNAHFPTQNYTLGDVAIEETTIRLRIVPSDPAIAPAYVFVGAEIDGYKVIWGPVASLTQEEANQFGIPEALAVQ